MRLSTYVLRSAAAGAMILGAVAASPAAAQSTVKVTVTAPKTITPGKTGNYTVTLLNNGPSTARGGTLTVTMPPEVTLSDVTGVAAAGCGDVVKATNSFTCPLDDIQDTASAKVVVTVALALPKPLTCPTGASIGAFTAAISGTGITQDAASTPSVASVPENEIADLDVALTGPDTVHQGEVVTFNTTVTNKGPCTAPAVVASLLGGQGMTLQSGTAPCGTDVKEGDDCNLGDMAPNAVVKFSRTYKVENVPADVMHSGVPNEVDVASDTADPNSDNDSATTLSLINASGNTGCASGGVAGLGAVAAMLVAAVVRRRRHA